jgi:hypothetical protein
MADHPIIFSAPMIRALQDGRKTQTRRIITPGNSLFNGGRWSALHKRQEWDWEGAWVDGGPSPMGNPGPYLKLPWQAGDDDFEGSVHRIYPVIQPGDRLWVKEAHYLTDDGDSKYAVYAEDQTAVAEHLEFMARLQRRYPKADWSKHLRLRSPIHMPRWASRITLTVTDVRVQRLQDISEADVVAEGIEPYAGIDPDCSGYRDYSKQASGGFWLLPRHSYRTLWNSLHGPDAWGANPWVWVKTFTVQHGNIDSIGGGE